MPTSSIHPKFWSLGFFFNCSEKANLDSKCVYLETDEQWELLISWHVSQYIYAHLHVCMRIRIGPHSRLIFNFFSHWAWKHVHLSTSIHSDLFPMAGKWMCGSWWLHHSGPTQRFSQRFFCLFSRPVVIWKPSGISKEFIWGHRFKAALLNVRITALFCL